MMEDAAGREKTHGPTRAVGWPWKVCRDCHGGCLLTFPANSCSLVSLCVLCLHGCLFRTHDVVFVGFVCSLRAQSD